MLSPAFKSYARDLHQLELLALSNQLSDSVADEIYDRMDRSYAHMSEDEHELSRVVSADLYDLREQPRNVDVQAQNAQHVEQFKNVMEAAKQRNWTFVLRNLRGVDRFMDSGRAAFTRARAWTELGDYDTASLFWDRARTLEPANPNFQFLALDTLSKSSRREEAERQAEIILAGPENYHPKLVAKAADLRYRKTANMTREAAVSIYEELVRIYDALIPRLRQEPTGSTLVEVLVTEGMCHEHLLHRQLAHQCYDQALQIEPTSEAALVARGILLYGQDEQALNDLNAAVLQKTRLVIPFLLLAHHALQIPDYHTCVDLCRAALSRGPTSKARADLHEWLAISLFAVGAPEGEVRAEFERAYQLAPDNRRIRSNRQKFEENVSAHKEKVSWDLEGTADLAINREELVAAGG